MIHKCSEHSALYLLCSKFQHACSDQSADLIVDYTLTYSFTVLGDQYPHITQIAAKELNSGKCFNRCVIPKMPIAASAERKGYYDK